MAALTVDRDTPRRDGGTRSFPVAASTKILAGSIVAVNASKYAVPGSVSTTLKAAGRAKAQADNSSGVAGAISVEVETGVFLFDNSTGADLIELDDIGSTCYIVDDQTVALTDGSSARSAAGTIFDVDADGVWVKFQ